MSRLYMMVTITDRNRKKKFEELFRIGRIRKGRNSIGGNRRNVEETKAGNDCKDADRRAGNRNCIYRATQQHRRRKNITFPDTEREI